MPCVIVVLSPALTISLRLTLTGADVISLVSSLSKCRNGRNACIIIIRCARLLLSSSFENVVLGRVN